MIVFRRQLSGVVILSTARAARSDEDRTAAVCRQHAGQHRWRYVVSTAAQG